MCLYIIYVLSDSQYDLIVLTEPYYRMTTGALTFDKR